jgi:hypothetical protein
LSLALSLVASLAPIALAAQSLAANAVPPRAESAPVVRNAVAVRAGAPPTLDGKDDDAIWRIAPAITEFQQFAPSSGAAPSFRTTVKVAYDDR